MNMIMTEQEARSLARTIELMRPTWQAAGIIAALGQARLKANKWTVALAAINAAAEDENRTPAVIPMEGRHWPVMEAPKSPPKFPKLEISDEEREAAHVQYLAAVAILKGKSGS